MACGSLVHSPARLKTASRKGFSGIEPDALRAVRALSVCSTVRFS